MKISEIITDKYKLRIPPTVYYELLADVQEAEEEQEPTTKNDLEVDCISRADAIGCLAGQIELSPSNVASVHEYLKCVNKRLHDLPSVTPQEPRWIPVSERLPDTDDEVLCWYEYYHWSQEKVLPDYGIGCYFKKTSAWYGEVAVGREVRVIAWMPLHPYKAESEVDNG